MEYIVNVFKKIKVFFFLGGIFNSVLDQTLNKHWFRSVGNNLIRFTVNFPPCTVKNREIEEKREGGSFYLIFFIFLTLSSNFIHRDLLHINEMTV